MAGAGAAAGPAQDHQPPGTPLEIHYHYCIDKNAAASTLVTAGRQCAHDREFEP